jgi:hypothetical protein
MEQYKPEIPMWVGKILRKKQAGDPLAKLGYEKEWTEYAMRHSRKLKYALLNGWTEEPDTIIPESHKHTSRRQRR